MSAENKKLPPNAHCVYKGTVFEVWAWDQKMYDGSTRVFEIIKRPDTVEVIATVGDKIIIEEQEQPDLPDTFLSMPGGRADQGSDMLVEAKREFLEETGYESSDWELWQEFFPSYHTVYSVHYFIARNCRFEHEVNPDAAGERIRIRLVTFDEFLMLSDDPRFRAPDLVRELLRVRLDPKRCEAFREMIFK